MAKNYSIGDFLIQIKNAARANRKSVTTQSTKMLVAVAGVLKKMGYLESVSTKDGQITVALSYHKKEPLLLDLKLVSKPGLRVYKSVDEIKARPRRGASQLVVSTPQNILSSEDAIKKNTGGEVICEIW
ncbi:30S ribosomal protein S8 [Candidatus Woesebacteria bacterium RIFCSPHIGHO2_01_FULL_41_10]|uniref:Small ribosomal subunit protein uS8 n=1 Tax=Candidatus Woesebacteria bacterium RIFCSPHIGHO2_01_FULL_41_10 TaxID=1802500 RepID=A0A1F7YSQ7_9BACT|nr:MAG: 30S ribosomal protein S8 [Candidatus Woesebacteria bacterium RIFCSPHIGHO2_01_FULL_41_10]